MISPHKVGSVTWLTMSLSTSDTSAHIWEIFLFLSFLFFSWLWLWEGRGLTGLPPPTLKTLQSQLKSNVTHQWNIKSISCLRAYVAHVRGSTYWSSCERINIFKKLISFEWTERHRKTSNKRVKLTFLTGVFWCSVGSLLSIQLFHLAFCFRFPLDFSLALFLSPSLVCLCVNFLFLSKGMGMGEEVTRGAQSWIKVDCRLYQTRLNMSDLTVTSTNTGESLFSLSFFFFFIIHRVMF